MLRTLYLVLAVVDEPLQLARHPAALIELRGLEDPADEALLILGVEDLATLGGLGLAPVDTQQPVGDDVERADSQPSARDTEQPLHTPTHLSGRLVGEGDGQDP